jgi:hypothetical protein
LCVSRTVHVVRPTDSVRVPGVSEGRVLFDATTTNRPPVGVSPVGVVVPASPDSVSVRPQVSDVNGTTRVGPDVTVAGVRRVVAGKNGVVHVV